MTRAPHLQVRDWSADCLRVPAGPLRGKPLVLGKWQVDWLRGALAPNTREAGLSVARKNGKSGLVAVALLAHLSGPLNLPHWRCLVASLTGNLARELWMAVGDTAEASGLEVDMRKTPQPGAILGDNGARVDFLNADKASGNAAGSDLAIIDEMGLLPERKRDLVEAMLASVSGRDGKFWAISIRGDGPMFAEMAERKDEPGVFWREYAAPTKCDLDDEKAWHAANPGLKDGIKSERYMRDMARRALAIPSNQAMFRAQDLNQPRSPTREMILEVDQWEAILSDAFPALSGRVVVGLDMGGSASMTAATVACLDHEPMTMRAFGAFPATPDLIARGKADGCGNLYARMEAAGELRTYPGLVTPVVAFIRWLSEQLGDCEVVACVSDKYRKAELQQAFMDVGLSWPMTWRRMGRGPEGFEDVRAFQTCALGKLIQTEQSLLMESAIASSTIERDVNGNPALIRQGRRGRIDALSAALLAVGHARRLTNAATGGVEWKDFDA